MADVEITDEQKASVAVGDCVTVRLTENATTGYLWSVKRVGDGLAVEAERSVPPAEAAPGAAGQHLLRIRATDPGTWYVDLRLGRAWEDTALEERRITLEVS